MRVLFIGEIVGKAGIYCLKQKLKSIKEEYQIDFVIANGNGVTGGFGLGKNHSIQLHKLGIDLFTSGECIYYKKDMVGHIWKAPYVLRPANYPAGNPGRGWAVLEAAEKKIAVLNFMGLSGYSRVHLNNPFNYIDDVIERVKKQTPVVVVNFHGATTAEKQTMGYYLDGKVSACIGTGQKCLTADDVLTPNKSFYITDAGRTGSFMSVGGLDSTIEMEKFLRQIPERSQNTMEGMEFQGIVLNINDEDGKTEEYQILKIPCQEKS
ncbi:MAG: TIGR00282 family metallophosphoesterase [Spirochaetaceae bacterium]|jgi:metallophosphoesterase (TIGR00282 family)|nr:TIGR00282 family metallophosphoesterase [Spirochaetaceae bacterium]